MPRTTNRRQQTRKEEFLSPENTIYKKIVLIGAVVAAMGSIYGAASTLNLAPVTNGQVKILLETHLKDQESEFNKRLLSFAEKKYVEEIQKDIDETKNKIIELGKQNSKIDERTIMIQSELQRVLTEVQKK
jgi:hypothetical protein